MAGELLHMCQVQYETEEGYTVICGCSVIFTRATRTDALRDWEGHVQVAEARRALNRADETKENDGA